MKFRREVLYWLYWEKNGIRIMEEELITFISIIIWKSDIVIREMVQAKLIKGISGKKGGYRLTRKPSEYTVGEILYLEETSISPVSCLLPDAEPCQRSSTCLTLPMWEKYDQLTKDFFYGITIQDLLDGNI